MADYVIFLVESRLSQKQGYGGNFKLPQLGKILYSLGYEDTVYGHNVANALKKIQGDIKILKKLRGKNSKDKSEGYKYYLPKNESQLTGLKGWYEQKWDILRQKEEGYEGEMPNNEEKNRKTLPHFFTKEKYVVYYGTPEGETITWSDNCYSLSNSSYSIFVAFEEKGKTLQDSSGKPLERMVIDALPNDTFYFTSKKQFADAVNYAKKRTPPVFYEVSTGSFGLFMAIMTNYPITLEI